MTGNQINYWALQENMRANRVNEGIKEGTLAETRRSNLVNESIKYNTLSETRRHNINDEGIRRADIAAKTATSILKLF